MDDWPSTISDRYFPKLIWRRSISKRLIQLLSKADVLFSISDAMSEEYFKRYGLNFMPFHNPIDIEVWLPHIKKDHNLNEKFITILYSGRIGTGIANSLLDVAEAIESLNQFEQKLELHIQTAVEEHDILKKLKEFKCVVINPVADYSQIPGIFSRADLLILANDFDAKARKFLKFSMPTKASEYMISGTPILVYSAEETAVTNFFFKNQCGYCVTRQGVNEIREAIKYLISDERYRHVISGNAVSLACEKFDAVRVRERFRDTLRNVCESRNANI
jgi:glycosyltransferase involved in cell wall biosynthesis